MNSETRVSSPPFLASILDALSPEIERNERLETAVGRGNSISRARPSLSMGLFVKRIMDLLLSAVALLLQASLAPTSASSARTAASPGALK